MKKVVMIFKHGSAFGASLIYHKVVLVIGTTYMSQMGYEFLFHFENPTNYILSEFFKFFSSKIHESYLHVRQKYFMSITSWHFKSSDQVLTKYILQES